MIKDFDFVLVGSGINSLCCAALLAKRGHSVCVLERSSYFGGCIKTEELTLPGFKHDVLSGFHPLFLTSPAYAELKHDLARLGVQYLNTEKPTAVVDFNNQSLLLSTTRQQNIACFNSVHQGDGDAFDRAMKAMEKDAALMFGLLGSELLSWSTLRSLLNELRQRGVIGLIRFFGEALGTARSWLPRHFGSEQLQALLAPWLLHTGLGPESNFSAAMVRVFAFSLESAGMPIVKGGSANLVSALVAVIEENGGELSSEQHVCAVTLRNTVATGVQTLCGNNYTANRAVICNVTPQQLYTELLPPQFVPRKILEDAKSYRYGRACMQIHLALSAPPQWKDKSLNDVMMVHVSDGIDAVSKAVNEAERGLLPERATIVVAQPTRCDPSRVPEGRSLLWIQLQELPSKLQGDAAQCIETPLDGQWTDEVKEHYADRIIKRLEQHIVGLSDIIMARSVLSPSDLEALNINLVGGDPYSGHCGMDQFLFWRPLKSASGHKTPIRKLFHIGASTHPGPGLGGTSGYLVANAVS